jgi:hypothetical protein
MFKVLVMDVRTIPDPHGDGIFETISEFTFLEKLYNFDLAFEFAWARDKDYQAEMLIHD